MKRLALMLAVMALVAAACAEGEVVGQDETTTTAAPTATEETTTTTAGETTTSVAETTTTAAPAGGSNEAFDELVDLIQNAAPLDSGRMEALVSVTGIEDQGSGLSEASFGFTTAFDTAANSSAFVMDLSSLADAAPSDPDDPFSGMFEGLFGTMEVRQIGDTAYVKMPFFNELLGVETPWLSMSADDGEGFTSDFSTVPSDPTDVMTAYDGADVTVEDLGPESVNGVEATHYRLSFDTTAWLDELTAEEQAELDESGLLADGVLPMDVWVTDEGQLVRLLFELDGTQVDAPEGEGFESMTMRYDLFDINEPITVEPPPASEVTDVDELGFGDFDFGVDA